ncbi:MAG: hypothetical protein AB9880_12150 [Christensenellales bacterium]
MWEDKEIVYQIRVRGRLDRQWADWFDGMAVTFAEDGDTLLTGPVKDQATLLGLIRKVRDLGIPLVSVRPVEPDEADAGGGKRNNQDDDQAQ